MNSPLKKEFVTIFDIFNITYAYKYFIILTLIISTTLGFLFYNYSKTSSYWQGYVKLILYQPMLESEEYKYKLFRQNLKIYIGSMGYNLIDGEQIYFRTQVSDQFGKNTYEQKSLLDKNRSDLIKTIEEFVSSTQNELMIQKQAVLSLVDEKEKNCKENYENSMNLLLEKNDSDTAESIDDSASNIAEPENLLREIQNQLDKQLDRLNFQSSYMLNFFQEFNGCLMQLNAQKEEALRLDYFSSSLNKTINVTELMSVREIRSSSTVYLIIGFFAGLILIFIFISFRELYKLRD
tara:strand:- start:640 stop:1518 length:879 start_codon:yes stop_codon:yes gene_type:complete